MPAHTSTPFDAPTPHTRTTSFQTTNPASHANFLTILLSSTHNRLMEDAMDPSLCDTEWMHLESAYDCATRAFACHNYEDTAMHLRRFWQNRTGKREG